MVNTRSCKHVRADNLRWTGLNIDRGAPILDPFTRNTGHDPIRSQRGIDFDLSLITKSLKFYIDRAAGFSWSSLTNYACVFVISLINRSTVSFRSNNGWESRFSPVWVFKALTIHPCFRCCRIWCKEYPRRSRCHCARSRSRGTRNPPRG